MSPIPEKDRTKLLKPFIEKCFGKLRGFPAPNPLTQLLITQLLNLWNKTHPGYEEEIFVSARQRISEAGFNGNELRKELLRELREILKEDPHLSICCRTAENLAVVIDLRILQGLLVYAHYVDEHSSYFEDVYKHFESELYAAPYRRLALFHLFNFEPEVEPLTLGNINILKKHELNIPRILGESTPYSSLHLPGVGNHFIIYQDTEPPGKDINEWLDSKEEESWDFLTLLRLFKDGIIDIDYRTCYFEPEWVNLIWKGGIYFIGDIRNDSVKPSYTLLKKELPKLKNYRLAQHKYSARLKNLSSGLGKTIDRTGIHLANYHEKELKEERFIDLIIALESLFTPSSRDELTYRISQFAGVLLGGRKKGHKVYEFIKDMMKMRGKLFHGQDDVTDKLIPDEKLHNLASLIREACLRFIVFYLRDGNSRDEIHQKIVKATFDSALADKIREESDPDRFVEEKI